MLARTRRPVKGRSGPRIILRMPSQEPFARAHNIRPSIAAVVAAALSAALVSAQARPPVATMRGDGPAPAPKPFNITRSDPALDARDFAAFGQLFARDGEFVAGAGTIARGPSAVGALLEKLIGTNFPDSKGRNFHLYFNETIDVQGDRATGISKGGFVMASEANNRVEFLQLATYVDELVREDGRWKFKKREIQGNIPVPRATSR